MSGLFGAVLALGGCGWSWLDPNDCAVSPDCEVYRPQGFQCGLQNHGFPGAPGARCSSDTEEWDVVKDALCPPGFQKWEEVYDDESSSRYWGCVADGNAGYSSARLSEVPAGSACGFASVGDVYPTFNPCLGVDVLDGTCPDGFELRLALDHTYNKVDCDDTPTTGDTGDTCDTGETGDTADTGDAGETDPPKEGAHLLAWCELGAGGCHGANCLGPRGICGLHAIGKDSVYFGDTLGIVHRSEIRDGLYDALLDALDEGEQTPMCLGEPVDVAGETCPYGLDYACIPDRTGSSSPDCAYLRALCFCAPHEVVIEYDSFGDYGGCHR